MSTAEDLANAAGVVSNARSSNTAKKYAQKIRQFKNYCALKTLRITSPKHISNYLYVFASFIGANSGRNAIPFDASKELEEHRDG